jgi:hypothetical protein
MPPDTGGSDMSNKDNFSSDEWARVVGAPMHARMAGTAADPGGLWSVLRESHRDFIIEMTLSRRLLLASRR